MLCLFLVGLILLYFGVIGPSNPKLDLLSALVAFGTFNFLHTLLTFFGLAAIPEMRQWLRSQLRRRRIFVFGPMILLIVFIAVQQSLSRFFGWSPPGQNVFETIFLILGVAHNFGQTKGLSLMFNRSVFSSLTQEEKTVSTRVERVERWLFNAYFILIIARSLGTKSGLIRADDYLARDPYMLTCMIFSGLLILNSCRYPRPLLSNKVFFLFGTFIYGFIRIFPMALLFSRALHGLEYTFLADRVVSQSKSRFTRRSVGVISALAIFLTIGFCFQPQVFPRKALHMAPELSASILAFFLAIEYLHYYLDSVLFRFQDADVKRHIAPIFAAP